MSASERATGAIPPEPNATPGELDASAFVLYIATGMSLEEADRVALRLLRARKDDWRVRAEGLEHG